MFLVQFLSPLYLRTFFSVACTHVEGHPHSDLARYRSQGLQPWHQGCTCLALVHNSLDYSECLCVRLSEVLYLEVFHQTAITLGWYPMRLFVFGLQFKKLSSIVSLIIVFFLFVIFLPMEKHLARLELLSLSVLSTYYCDFFLRVFFF